MRTDGAIAVVKLKECKPVNPEINADSSESSFKVSNRAFRYLRREILTFRSDLWRANIIYGIYDARRIVLSGLRPPTAADGNDKMGLLTHHVLEMNGDSSASKTARR